MSHAPNGGASAGGSRTHEPMTTTPPDIVDFQKFPVRPQEDNPGESGDEYLVDIETHTVLLVRATTPETAVAKAVLHAVEPDDENVTEVARDVHTCVHSGIDDGECDHKEE